MEEINTTWNHPHTTTATDGVLTHTHTLTYVHGQVHTLTDVREAKHLLPFPASAFTASTCRHGDGGSDGISGSRVMKTRSPWWWRRTQTDTYDSNVHVYTRVQPVRFQTIVCSTTVNGLLIALKTGKQSLWDRITLQLTFKLQWPCCHFSISPECICLAKQNISLKLEMFLLSFCWRIHWGWTTTEGCDVPAKNRRGKL